MYTQMIVFASQMLYMKYKHGRKGLIKIYSGWSVYAVGYSPVSPASFTFAHYNLSHKFQAWEDPQTKNFWGITSTKIENI